MAFVGLVFAVLGRFEDNHADKIYYRAVTVGTFIIGMLCFTLAKSLKKP
jgi:peptide subunit release factor RF-3